MAHLRNLMIVLLATTAVSWAETNLVREPFMTETSETGLPTTLPNGNKAIVFAPDAPLGTAAIWKRSSPINPGWHTVEFEFDHGVNSRKFIDFQFLDQSESTILSANLYHLPSKTGSSTRCRLGVYLPREATSIRWRKNQNRNMHSTPLVGLFLSDGRPVNGSASLELVAMSIATGRMSFPKNLGGGHFQLIADRPISVRWTDSEMTSFTTPASREVAVFMEQPLIDLETTDHQVSSAHLERRFEEPSPMDQTGLGQPLMTVFGENTVNQVIEIHGSGLDPTQVAIADYPEGAHMAAVQSWDDGIPQDLRTATLLNRHGWRGTFFFNRNSQMLDTWKSLQDLGMEIGSHSWSHPFYPLQSPQRCRDESVLLRKLLENRVGYPVISFAYPFNYSPAYDFRGDYVLRAQREAGYLSCRTTMNGPLSLDALGDPLVMRPSAHFLAGKQRLDVEWKRAASTTRGIFYLWGHSYEMNQDRDWQSFEEMLRYYGRRPGVWYASQGDLMIWKNRRESTDLRVSGNSNHLVINIQYQPLHAWWRRRVPLAIQIPGMISSATTHGNPLAIQSGVVQIFE